MPCKRRLYLSLSILGAVVLLHNFWKVLGLKPVFSAQNAETHETSAALETQSQQSGVLEDEKAPAAEVAAHTTSSSTLQLQRQRPSPTTSDCIVFFHIPKAGGSSFNMFLNRVQETMGWKIPNWGTYWFQHHRTPPSELSVGETDKGSFTANSQVIHRGHLTPSFLDFTSTQNCLTFTMLREPVDRVISAFYYHGHKTREWDTCLKHNNNSSNLSRCKHSHEYQNAVTRLFSSNATWTSYDETPFAAEPKTLDRAQHLLSAQQFLLNVDLVCFLDNIDDCQRELLTLANLTQKIPIPAANAGESKKENVNTKRENVTLATRQAITLANELDIELYEWAVQQFQDSDI
jgi:hypothetical protein